MSVVVDWVDNTTTTFTPGTTASNTNGTTLVDILAAPAASTQRKVNSILVSNLDSVSKVVSVFLNDNGTSYRLTNLTLQINETLGYTDVQGWYVLDTSGAIKGVGPTGATGAQGPQGATGVFGVDGQDGEDSLPIPGPQGIQGVAGAQGIQGPIGIKGLDGEDGEDGWPIPGPAGPAGASGAPPFADSTALVKGSIDATKLLAFEADTNIPTATTVTVTPQSQSGTLALVQNQIQPITASVGSNALTITLNPTAIAFRSATLGSGTVNVRSVNTAISMVVSSGSTLGTTNAVQSRLIVIALDNAGTVELAVVNQAGLNDLSETGVITTTAEGGAGAADSINVIYSTTARTSVPYRVVGYVESTQATAGTWATAPSTIQGVGGMAIAAMNSLGYGQSYVNQTGSRAVSTTYYNTTGKPRYILVYGSSAATSATITLSINGATAVNIGRTDLPSGTAVVNGYAIIPPFASYLIAGITTVASWVEFG